MPKSRVFKIVHNFCTYVFLSQVNAISKGDARTVHKQPNDVRENLKMIGHKYIRTIVDNLLFKHHMHNCTGYQ